MSRESPIPARYCQFTEILVVRNARSETNRRSASVCSGWNKKISVSPAFVPLFTLSDLCTVSWLRAERKKREPTDEYPEKNIRSEIGGTEIYLSNRRGISIKNNTPTRNLQGGRGEGIEQARQPANRSGRTNTRFVMLHESST